MNYQIIPCKTFPTGERKLKIVRCPIFKRPTRTAFPLCHNLDEETEDEKKLSLNHQLP